MRIAVVGSGIAGLTASWLLDREGHQVVLIERLPELGLAAHGMTISIDGETLSADIPSRMFNQALWPSLYQLYCDLGVETEEINNSQTFGELDAPPAFRLGDSFFSQLIAGRSWKPEYRKIRNDILRMKATAEDDLAICEHESVDFKSYLDSREYSAPFRELFLLPSLASTVCTCSYDSLLHYPAATILRAMMALTSGDPLLRARHGSQDIGRRLIAPLSDIRCNTALNSVTVDDSGVHLELSTGESLAVEHLVMATQANTAIKVLDKVTDTERKMLESFAYEDVKVVLHRDEALMPPDHKAWGTFNIMTNTAHDAAMCTVWMNRFCPEWTTNTPLFQTIMPLVEPNSKTVFCERHLQRPIVNQQSLVGLTRLSDLHCESGRRIWFCGSYASAGVPLLESGVKASYAICQALADRG
jgi:predicted NAD/FAD-binding protein